MTSTYTGTELYLCSETLAISKMFLIPLEMDRFGSFSQGKAVFPLALCAGLLTAVPDTKPHWDVQTFEEDTHGVKKRVTCSQGNLASEHLRPFVSHVSRCLVL